MAPSNPPLPPSKRPQQAEDLRLMPAVANASLLLASLAGAALLLWWATKFHQDNRQLWMVPLGLVLMGTPIVIWFSVVMSDAWRFLEQLLLAEPGTDEAVTPTDREVLEDMEK